MTTTDNAESIKAARAAIEAAVDAARAARAYVTNCEHEAARAFSRKTQTQSERTLDAARALSRKANSALDAAAMTLTAALNKAAKG